MTHDTGPVLHAKGISKFFPGTIALDEVDLRLEPGEVHALLGENGAGKSTLIKCLTGAYQRDGGSIHLDGQEVSPQSTADSQRLGIGTVYQEVNLLPNLTVAENLYLGRQPMRWGLMARRRMNAMARETLAGYGLDIDPAEPLTAYSVAIQQVVAIARAVEMSGKVLILDEPTASLDRDEVQLLFSVIRQLRERGLAVVFITHFLDQVFEISDRATILRNGRVVGTRVLADVSQKDVVTLMLGRQLEAQVHERKPAKAGDTLIEVDGLGKRGMLEPLSLALREGEVVGLAGLLGSGRTETANLMFGAVPADQGRMLLRGKEISVSTPREAVKHRFALCPEDRKTEGIVGDLSVRDNIILARQASQGWMRPIPRAEVNAIAERYVKALDIRLASLDMPIRLLSGGNQQKALLARWLATNPDFLILDEPTRGIDVGAHAEIIALIEQLRADGMALLVASSELEELVAYSTRVIVLRDRKQVRELAGAEITPENIVHAIAEHDAPTKEVAQ
ncbi:MULTISPECIES: sugar ABC transporter ATP-binding protein [Mameliella]|uniref:sugar ABC transporter ATP-binding protein n=1 Tax=Mameliella TaxID=1434019 RepID=UPI00084106BE|nr:MULTISPECIES: sugar ABC transporter ATP-binding protein [Mameliella]ODM46464.1 sugar ABC transporter ATP-binding protein [Ruegeria sp. PBVC088]MBY6117741.1 sugar ABC transporter ATP-binding protein [Mameliella alba]MDD9729773.1 sugar ABC transporter ATP-binding protein [Mameliella sp. AT18]OWV44473.1 sugar ABC transporter ATP-binding protein [Mameliella alba]OWV65116.1 sugar ABC transporter ATP-binding protein [Mameliella alba]